MEAMQRAYLEAYKGNGKAIAGYAFGGGMETAMAKASRRLADQADRLPTWKLLEGCALYGHRDPLLDYFGTRLRVEWRPIPDPPAVLRARVIERLERLESLLEQVRAEMDLVTVAEALERKRRA
jgi:hypothetical protein